MKRALGLLIAGLLGASAAFASNSLTVTSPGLAPGPTTTGKKLQLIIRPPPPDQLGK